MRISQRNKKSTLTVTERFYFPYESQYMKISGMPDAWYKLYSIATRPDELGTFIYTHFILPAVRHLNAKRPRGPHKSNAKFINKVKTLAAYNYCFLDYWLGKSREEWPEPIKKVVQEFEDEMGSYFPRTGKKKHPKALEIVAYMIERDFGEERQIHQTIKPWTDDIHNFDKVYVSGSGFVTYYKLYLELLGKWDDPSLIFAPENLSLVDSWSSGKGLRLRNSSPNIAPFTTA
ncbi:MAG: hypothetical protein HXY44_12210 [Syntrophaceae bacterium]|nr:hypothetical protein [Syntrophaceae bacterium]